MTRRDCLGLPAAAWLSAGGLRGQEGGELEALNRFPRMVQEWTLDQVRRAQRERLERFEAVRTADDARAWVASAREKIARSFGPMPEKTPLKARVTGGLERDAYRVENVIFESRPGFLVTANLYLPKGRLLGRAPGVVGTCGHSSNGKASVFYQAFAQGLARQGYAVLLYDPIGQGERLQYVDDDLEPLIGPGTREHLLAGNQQFLTGDFIGTWRAWDGIRALDYLLTRDEVDPTHLGVTGNSGGGTMTTWLAGLDERWTMAAPSCFVTTFRRNLENELPQDTEQCPPRAIALGLDHEDFLATLAPKPVIVLAKEKDYFDARGTEKAYGRLKRLWGLLGAEDNVSLFIGPTYHGYSQENREAMYRWFNRATGVSDRTSEPELVMEDDETLYATPKGQVAGLGSKTVFGYTREKAERLAKRRESLVRPLLGVLVRRALRIRLPEEAPYARILRNRSERGYPREHATTYALETERGIQALVTRLQDEQLMSRPPRATGPATLYVSHHSADAELRESEFARKLAADAEVFFAVDVRGIGESRPDTTREDSFLTHYGSDYFYAVQGLMLDRPYVGGRVLDVLSVIRWLGRYGHSEVRLAGAGWGSVPAQFAALLSPAVKSLELHEALESYESVCRTERYEWPLSVFLPGVLARFDLPQVRQAAEERGVTITL